MIFKLKCFLPPSMKKYLIAFYLLFLLQGMLMPANAWGYSVHKEVAERAIEKLPENWKTWLQAHVQELREGSIFPDENKDKDPNERPRHYDDSDIPHTDINVSSTSENYSLGVVSWAAMNTSLKLVEAIKQNQGNEVLLLMGSLSHYLSDASQPFHATSNFDGQLTGNDGIHSRFETILPDKYWEAIWQQVEIGEPKYVSDIYNATKAAIASGLAVVPLLLEADDKAKESGDYWGTFYNETSEILVERLELAIQLTMDAWFSAITDANSLNKDLTQMIITTPKVTKTSSSALEADASFYPALVIPTFIAMALNKKKKL